MSNLVLALFAALPIIVAGILIVLFRMPAKYAMPISFISAALVAATIWKVDVLIVAAASTRLIHEADLKTKMASGFLL